MVPPGRPTPSTLFTSIMSIRKTFTYRHGESIFETYTETQTTRKKNEKAITKNKILTLVLIDPTLGHPLVYLL
jgi:hypothetical protein